MIYLISDTHFYHDNIIKYCNRPFKDYKEMNRVLIDNWNKVVSEKDVVYHLGDFAKGEVYLKELVSKLNGKIYLLRGNHDKKNIKFYKECGLEVIRNKTKLEEYKVILSHSPLLDGEIPEGYVNIHGHIHNNDLDDCYLKDRHINVSVENIGYKPVEIEELLAK